MKNKNNQQSQQAAQEQKGNDCGKNNGQNKK